MYLFMFLLLYLNRRCVSVKPEYLIFTFHVPVKCENIGKLLCPIAQAHFNDIVRCP